MLAVHLSDQILSFVQGFYVVEERQIQKFFADWGGENVNKCLSRLYYEKRLYKIDDSRVSTVKELPMQVHAYMDIISAVWVLCTLRSENVRWCSLDNYPSEIVFVTEDDIIYDICVFREKNLASKVALMDRTRGMLDFGEEDPVKHIAVVDDLEMFRRIEHLGWYGFATVDRNGKVAKYVYDD